ncbi:MAG: NAD kinase [Bacteroidetes bacterium 4572_128]|nr:MAG: NAD kinase [Bacteroidetes bacterium 4572_128]
MKIAIFGRNFRRNFYKSIFLIFLKLKKENIKIIIFKPYYNFIIKILSTKKYKKIREKLDKKPISFFEKSEDLECQNVKILLSIGGDGTFLDAVSLVRNFNIPLIGINVGRLGFLSTISQNEISSALDYILKGDYEFEERILIEMEDKENKFNNFPFALNECAIVKKDITTLITLHVYINGEFLNSYWADGLIISTPTGSTAYSLSVGGPIVVPNSNNFIIAPISPHNLTMRPIIVSDDNEISIKVESRNYNFFTSLDSRSYKFSSKKEIKLKKANFKIKILKLKNQTYFSTLRNKLMWGADKRNFF